MRILTRYMLREFLVPVFYCMVTFTMVYVVLDLFSRFDKITAAHPPFKLVLRYYAGYMAPLMPWILPASLLLAGLYAMWQLSRHSEIIAMRASGVGFGAITAPLLWAAVALALLSAINSEFFTPDAHRLARLIAKSGFRPPSGAGTLSGVPYNNYTDQRVWRIGRFDPERPDRLMEVRVTQEGSNSVPRFVMTAERAEHLDGVWWFFEPSMAWYDENGNLDTTAPASMSRRSVMAMPDYRETPRDFVIEQVFNKDREAAETMSLRDMMRYVEARPMLTRELRLARQYDIHYRLAAPWACVVITLFAIPAGVASGRQSVFKGVLLAIALFFSFYAVAQICMAMAKKDIVPPGIGAWLPNVLFLAAGLALFARQR